MDVLPGRTADVVERWLRDHPGVQIICRDRFGAYAEAARRAVPPSAVQAGDRWHLWHGLAGAAQREVAAHASCWAAAGPPVKEGKRAETTAGRWREVHDLLGKGTGPLECSRRLGLPLNTIKRYARAAEPDRLVRAPQYRPTLAGPYRDHLRARRAEDPAVPVQQLLREIRELGYACSSNLLVRYITQGRVESDRPHLSPRRVARLLLTRPAPLSDTQQALLSQLTAACPEMTSLALPSGPSPPCSSQIPATTRSSRNGPVPRGPRTCQASTPSPGAWTSTRRPSPQPSPCRSITAGPRA